MNERVIFMEALDKDTLAERSAYLDEACGGDAAVRQRVEALLMSHEQAGSFLGKPVPERLAEGLAAPAEPTETQGELPTGDGRGERLDFLTASDKSGSLGRLGHYEVLEVIGQGGFGIVLRAFDEMLHRVVAVKVIAPPLAATSPARQRFLREARAAAAVRHENVVAIYAVEEQPIPYLVMEYIAGQTLQAKLDQSGPLGTAEVLRIGQQVAGGLAAAHARGLIHRDVKPANILLENGADRVKITDFGLARAADDASLTQSGVIAGTPMYMAPEQAQGEVIDHRADLFSLGSVLYTACSGRPPFRATTMLAVLKRVCEDMPRPIRDVIPEVPEWLVEIIARLQAKDPAERFQSAREVADVMGRELAALQHGGLERPPTHRPAPPAKRSRRLLVAAALVVALGVLGVVGYLLAPTVLRIVAKKGELVIEREDSTRGQAAKPPAADLFKDAVLYMTFAKDTFYEKEGKTYVRDLSGRGNDGLCNNVAFTPDGKAGGGLLCQGGQLQLAKSLINGQPNYTITAWCRCEKPGPAHANHHLYLTATPEKLNEICFNAHFPPERTCHVNAWNADLPEQWIGANTGGSTVPAGWFFVAIALTDGETGKGKLRIVIDDRIHARTSQMVAAHGEPQPVDVVGYNMNGVIDELAVFQRALSDEEIQTIRKRGIGGHLQAKTPPPAGPMYQDAVLHMTFAKDTFYEKEGKTYVRDLSGNGYDGLCEGVAYTPEGKAGGGLKFDGKGWLRIPHSLLNHRANYTVAAWVRLRENAPDGELVREFTSQKDESIYHASLLPGGVFFCAAFNRSATENWFNRDKAGVFPYEKWVFLTIALENGGVETGSLRVTMDDKKYLFPSQMVDSTSEDTSVTLGKNLEGKLGEVVVFHRFLSAREIEAIRQRGLGGDRNSQSTQTVPPPSDFTNTIGMKLKLIKPGTFTMGSPKVEEDHMDNEGPQHEVEITKAFYMGAHAVTKGQFAAFVKDEGYQTEAEKDGKGGWRLDLKTGDWEAKPEYTWRHPGSSEGDDYPVVMVSWNDATAFCAWLSKKEGKTYALPTEAEWEYACRAGTKTRFWCGDAEANLQGNANIADGSLQAKCPAYNRGCVAWDDRYAFTSPVGSFKANPWGLYDMHGNVWQWSADGYDDYQEGSIKDPKGKEGSNRRVLRGGAWDNVPRNCRSAVRNGFDPGHRSGNFGFRVVSPVYASRP